MKFLSITILIALAVICGLAEQKSRRWYDDRLLLRLQGFLVGVAFLVIWL